MANRIRVQTSCRDCTMCTGNAFSNSARGTGYAVASVATLGLAKLARNDCRGCGHPMSEHGIQSAPVTANSDLVAAAGPPPAGFYPDPITSVQRYWDGEYWEGERPIVASNDIDQLQRLADLHDRGALTDDEFTAAKAKLLGL